MAKNYDLIKIVIMLSKYLLILLQNVRKKFMIKIHPHSVSAKVLNVDIGSELVTKLFAAKNLKHFDDDMLLMMVMMVMIDCDDGDD